MNCSVIRTGLLRGKLSQTSQSLYVIQSFIQSFEKEHWEILERRMSAWKVNLQSVIGVINNAKRIAGRVPQVPVPVPPSA